MGGYDPHRYDTQIYKLCRVDSREYTQLVNSFDTELIECRRIVRDDDAALEALTALKAAFDNVLQLFLR